MKMRRVVTADDIEGKSVVKWDNEVEGVPGRPARPGLARIQMWASKKLPAELAEEDPIAWDLGRTIAGGSVFRFTRFDPGHTQHWHRTDTIDYAFVVSGEITMQLDKEEVLLKAGDVVIQRGTLHNWANNGQEPCIILFVLIATEGDKSTGH